MAAHPQARLTPEQYLEIERRAEFRNEFYHGVMYLMPGGTYTHVQIIGNLTRELGNLLKGRPCSVNPVDMRVRVSEDGLYTYPDITVVCGEPYFADARRDTLLNPILIIEVLSPSTEGYDRGFKFAQYRGIESVQEYCLVAQNEPRVEVFRRQPSGEWLLGESVGLGAARKFQSLDISLSLAEIYYQVEFVSGDPLPPRPTENG